MALAALAFGSPVLAASIWTHPAFSIFLMVIGFGMLIFVHEMGHFLAAKWVGIKVEEFALGFGRKLIGIRRGETLYRLNVLPLGGYVKMLGQDDFKPKQSEDADPRAYNNRPIWARIFVVSSGVVMNVVFAALLFIVLFLVGMRYTAPQVGDVVPGYPAATVELPGGLGRGLQPGDDILAINGEPVRKYEKIMLAGMLSDAGESFRFTIRRPLGPDGEPVTFDVNLTPRDEIAPSGAVRHSFGIAQPVSRTLADAPDLMPPTQYAGAERFRPGDEIVRFAGQEIHHGWQLVLAQRDLTGHPFDVVVRRHEQDQARELSIRLEPHLGWSRAWQAEMFQKIDQARRAGQPRPELEAFHVLGLQPRIRVNRPIDGSPADQAGIRAGDVIVRYGDPPTVPTAESLPRLSKDYLGSSARIWLLRDGQEIGPLEVAPRKGTRHGGSGKETVGLIGVETGLDQHHLVVADVRADSPLSGQIDPGDVISAVDDMPVGTWGELVDALAARAGEQVVLHYRRPGGATGRTEPLALTPQRFLADWYAYDVALPMDVQMGEPVHTYNPALAAWWGIQETGDFILTTYVTLAQWIKGRISAREFSGPVGIFRAGVVVGSRGVEWIVWLLAIISANLAVINFLPLPIVDGGHVVLLLVEKARGKPLSVKVQNAIQVIGLITIAVVFVLITYNDIAQWVRRSW